MGRRRCLGVLAGFLLISVAVGVRDAAAVGRLRVLMEAKEGDKSVSGKEAGSHSTTAPPVEGSLSSPNSVPKNPPPPSSSSDSPPTSRAPPNPPAAPQKASPSNPVSGNLPNPAPAAKNLSASVAGSPSHPPPAPGGPVNPPPSSSGSSSDRSPPPAGRSRASPASDGRSSPPPVSGNRPPPAEAKHPNTVPSEHGRETPKSGKDEKEKEKKKQADSSSNPDGSQGKGQETDKCNSSITRCHVEGLVACLQQSQNERQKWFLLVQNEGESPVKVNVLAPPSAKIDKTLSLAQRNQSKIEFHVDAAEGLRVVLNAGNGECTLQVLQPSSAGNIFQQFPNYAYHVTPIYGVYFASLTVIFVGGTWACCKYRKRRRVDAGVAYQQLEMGTQRQSSALVDEDEMNGWDEDWNDDWDEEAAATRPPEKRGSASENGVTFRSSDKNEWEDWDD